MLSSVMEVLSLYEAVAEEKELKIIEPKRDSWLLEDPHLLRIVLDTILSNAIKYSPRGGVIRIGITENKHGLTVSIMDEGPGIAKNMREKIFMKSFRGPGASVENVEGSGLGLYLAQIVMNDFIKGRIRVRSRAENGTVFYCDFPTVSRASERPLQNSHSIHTPQQRQNVLK